MKRKYNKKIPITTIDIFIPCDIIKMIFNISIHSLYVDVYCKIRQYMSILHINKSFNEIYDKYERWLDLYNYFELPIIEYNEKMDNNEKLIIKNKHKSYIIHVQSLKNKKKEVVNYRKINDIGYCSETKKWLIFGPETHMNRQLTVPNADLYKRGFTKILTEQSISKRNFNDICKEIGIIIKGKKRTNLKKVKKIFNNNTILIDGIEYKLNI